MGLYLYNSLTKRKDKFHPLIENQVGMYTCGPTVNNFSHIGNFRTFMFEDLLKRWLLHLGYKVNHVMNITDVDDKTIKKSIEEKISLQEITNKYSSEFMSDLNWLEILPANHFPRATEYISEMISMIKKLLKKDMAYIDIDGSIYFKISSFQNYGCLVNVPTLGSDEGASNILDDEYSSEFARDFALWKGWKKSDGGIYWDSPWGKGRPGWHIECSAMSTKLLGNHFDIHCGGIDNIFPHHENEIAQSIGANGNKFVNYWLHSEHLMVDGGKMSKKKKNFLTVNELKALDFSAQSIRYQLLAGHYRNKISFSINKKHEGDKIIERISNFYYELIDKGANKMSGKQLPKAYQEFKKHLNNDLDTPKALAVFFDWMKLERKINQNDQTSANRLKCAWNFLLIFDSIFRFVKHNNMEIPIDVNNILSERKKARQRQDWEYSDILRQRLLNFGYLVEDTKDGQKLKKYKK